MKHYDETDEYDRKYLAKLNAPTWMLPLLSLNPEYTGWAPGDDYMHGAGDGWQSAMSFASWAEHSVMPDDLNEVVNFYFEINRASKQCEACDGSGYHEDAKWIADSFYDHSNPFRSRFPRDQVAKYGAAFAAFAHDVIAKGAWHDRITQDEVDALIAEGRLFDFTHRYEAGKGWVALDPAPMVTAESVNAWSGEGMGHDAINRCILIRQRCERLGVPLHCGECGGNGYVYVEPEAKLNLVYWSLHPRKGASRGVTVHDIREADLPAVFAFLKAGANRNAQRFVKVVAL